MRLASVVLALVITASGCTHGVPQTISPSSSNGTFEFNQRVPGSDRTLRGTLELSADTAIVESATDPCLYDARASHGRSSMTYHCGDVTYTVDRGSSDVRVAYTFYNVVTDRKSVCVQYSTNAQGQQVCSRTSVENVERKVPVSGDLQMRTADK